MDSLFFTRDFYPTPKEVIDLMGVQPFDKVVLEPHGGSGNMIDWLRNNGARRVLTCESNQKLAKICSQKADEFISDDFLSVVSEQVSHVDIIMMNPPFSNAATHINHAYKIAPKGCEIFTLINTENLDRSKHKKSADLKEVLQLPYQRTDLGQCFNYSERKTGVSVSLLVFRKPKSDEDYIDWSIFTDEPDIASQKDGVVKYDQIASIVNAYVYSCRMYKGFASQAEIMNNANSFLGNYRPVKAGVFKESERYGLQMIQEHEYRAQLQRGCWKKIFHLLNLEKYLTSGVMEDVNRFSEQQSEIPFTLKNVYTMVDMIFQTRDQSFQRGLVEAINSFTKHTHKNRYEVEGWKTNSGYMLNKKFIMPYAIRVNEWKNKPELNYLSHTSKHFSDLIKCICNIRSYDFDLQPDLWNFFQVEDRDFGKWYSFGVFELKAYKKGTMHVRFKSEDDWTFLNRAYAKALGQVLPETI